MSLACPLSFQIPGLRVPTVSQQKCAPLPNVEETLRRIQQLSNSVNILFGDEANRDNVLAHLPEHAWVHFACYGHRNPEPFHSSFQLHGDARLELLDLIAARLPNFMFFDDVLLSLQVDSVSYK